MNSSQISKTSYFLKHSFAKEILPCFTLAYNPRELTSTSSTGSYCWWLCCVPVPVQPQAWSMRATGQSGFSPGLQLHLSPASLLSLARRHSISVTALASPGNIGQRSVLGCTFEPNIQMDSITIQWAKEGVAGLVHEFKGGKDHLQEQDPSFQGRTAMFVHQVMGGNASLELRDVQLSDAGTYQCSVTTARGSGAAVLQYRTGGEGYKEQNPAPKHVLVCLGLTYLCLCWCCTLSRVFFWLLQRYLQHYPLF